MLKVDVYGDVYDDGEPDDADEFNFWLDEIEQKKQSQTIDNAKYVWPNIGDIINDK